MGRVSGCFLFLGVLSTAFGKQRNPVLSRSSKHVPSSIRRQNLGLYKPTVMDMWLVPRKKHNKHSRRLAKLRVRGHIIFTRRRKLQTITLS